jgi:hypothetical protein
VKKNSYKPNKTHADEVKGLTASVKAFDGFVSGVGIVATMAPLPGFAIRLALIWTVTCVDETNVYGPRDVVPFQVSDPPATKPEPFIVSVKGGLPAGTLAGERDVKVAPGILCPPPPPPPP